MGECALLQPGYKKGGQVCKRMQHLGRMSLYRALESNVRWCSTWLGPVHLQASALPAGLGSCQQEGQAVISLFLTWCFSLAMRSPAA